MINIYNSFNFMIFSLNIFFLLIIIFPFMVHPLILGLLLVISTIFIAFSCFFISIYSWSGYILLMMFLGGLLILFLYNISFLLTEMFFFNYNLIILISLFLIFSMKDSFSEEMMVLFFKNMIPIMMFYMNYNFIVLVFLTFYLFFCLICIVNVVYMNKDKGSFLIF